MSELPRDQLLARVQNRLEGFYRLERIADVRDFVHTTGEGGHETVLVRERDGELELAVMLPPEPMEGEPLTLDGLLQVVEGVSHFLYVAERARRERRVTQLELELQAEVDKFVALWFLRGNQRLRRSARDQLETLFGQVRYLHAADTEQGARYRLANRLAARFVSSSVRHGDCDSRFRRFHRAGQADKIRMAA